MAKQRGGRKGNPFEREICKELSSWWTGGKRDDIFWRSATSGARATVRFRKGKRTAGGCGDICALDPIGEPLLDVMTIEVKRGYSRHTIFDLIDRRPSAAAQMWEKWIEQAERESRESGSFAWAIISRRDMRETLICLPCRLSLRLPLHPIQVIVDLPPISCWMTTLSSFLQTVKPSQIKHLSETL